MTWAGTWAGLDSRSGATIGGLDHLRQSVTDILTTPIGSRVMRRDYGSDLADLIDGNLTPLTLALIYAATAEALARWEPRLEVTRLEAEATAADLEDGRVQITIEGFYLPEGRPVALEGIVV